MKKWQKIVGVTIISALIIAHIWALTDYLFVAELAETYCAEMGQDLFFDCIYNFKEHFGATMYWQCLILYLLSGYSQLFGGKGVKNESLLGKYRIQVYK